jgi:hypothetical protein
MASRPGFGKGKQDSTADSESFSKIRERVSSVITNEKQTKRKSFTGSEAWKNSENQGQGGGRRIERVIEKKKFQKGK